jgi:hypothetical protein
MPVGLPRSVQSAVTYPPAPWVGFASPAAAARTSTARTAGIGERAARSIRWGAGHMVMER